MPALVLTLALTGASGSTRAADPAPVNEVAPGVFVHTGQIAEATRDNDGDTSNWGFVVGERCIAVIDSGGSTATGEALLAAIRSQSPLPVCAVISTHVHPDHILGNAALASLKPAPEFVASQRLPAALAARQSTYTALALRQLGADRAPVFVAPTSLVGAQTVQINLGNRDLTVRSWPTAHTDNDLTVSDETSGTLFAGDLLFVDHIPVLDGSLTGWLAQIPTLRALSATRVVPGHGGVASGAAAVAAAWDREHAYLLDLRDQLRASLRIGNTLARAVDTLTAPAGWQLTELYHRRNVTAAYAELEWED